MNSNKFLKMLSVTTVALSIALSANTYAQYGDLDLSQETEEDAAFLRRLAEETRREEEAADEVFLRGLAEETKREEETKYIEAFVKQTQGLSDLNKIQESCLNLLDTTLNGYENRIDASFGNATDILASKTSSLSADEADFIRNQAGWTEKEERTKALSKRWNEKGAQYIAALQSKNASLKSDKERLAEELLAEASAYSVFADKLSPNFNAASVSEDSEIRDVYLTALSTTFTEIDFKKIKDSESFKTEEFKLDDTIFDNLKTNFKASNRAYLAINPRS